MILVLLAIIWVFISEIFPIHRKKTGLQHSTACLTNNTIFGTQFKSIPDALLLSIYLKASSIKWEIKNGTRLK